MAPEILPVLDPADHALMLTPEQLRNQNTKNLNVSFLRKTQYMSSQNARTNDPLMRSNARAARPINHAANGRQPQLARQDPLNIKRHIQKGFDLAYPDSTIEGQGAIPTAAEREAWQTPTHPDNPRLKPVAFYPIKPDLDGFTDDQAYTSLKFDKAPLPAISGRRDDRLDVSFLRVIEPEKESTVWKARFDAWEKNPDLYDHPGSAPYQYELHIPRPSGSVPLIKKILNDADPAKNDESLYEGLWHGTDEPALDYIKSRSYGTGVTDFTRLARFMALSLFDADAEADLVPPHSRLKPQGTGAYIYPISKRLKLRAERGTSKSKQDDVDQTVDGLVIQVRDADAKERFTRAQYRAALDPGFVGELEQLKQAMEEQLLAEKAAAAPAADPAAAASVEEEEGDGDEDGDEDGVGNGASENPEASTAERERSDVEMRDRSEDDQVD